MVCFAKESYKHNQTIKFSNSGFGVGVYSKVYVLNEKPDHNSKTIKEIEKRVDDTKMYNVLALTKEKYPDEEGKNPSYWGLIDFNGIECWIHGSHCSKEIGGPTFMIPENRVYFELVYANEI